MTSAETTPPRSPAPQAYRAIAGGILLLAAALRLYSLDGQLWVDEISALRGYRKPFLEILTRFPSFFPNPLYELLAHASIRLFGESAWSIRLPAALSGVAGVGAFLLLAHRSLGGRTALLAAALLAVSYHHIFYSQDARGYTTYLCFALLATWLLLALLERPSRRLAGAYVAAVALGTYAHPFGLFLPVGQLAVALPAAWLRRRAEPGAGVSTGALVATGLAAALAIAALYAPLIPASLAYVGNEAQAAHHGPRVGGLLPELLSGLRAGLGGWTGLALAVGVAAWGALDWLRRSPLSLLLLGVPLGVAAGVTGLLGVGIHPRYFLLALPAGLLAGARGLLAAGEVLLARLPEERRTRALAAVSAAAVAVTALALPAYYRVPKQDFRGALAELQRRARPGDGLAAADLAGRAIQRHYDPELPLVEDLPTLLRMEAETERVFVLTTLEGVMASRTPELLAHLRQDYELVAVLPGLVGDGALRLYARAGPR